MTPIFYKINMLLKDLKKVAINKFRIKYQISNCVNINFQDHGGSLCANMGEKVWLLVKDSRLPKNGQGDKNVVLGAEIRQHQ